MTDRLTILTLARMEADSLTDLVDQFLGLVVDATPEREGASDQRLAATDDPAVRRLLPAAYPDDATADRELRETTDAELLDRRADDARTVLAGLALVTDEDDQPGDAVVDVPLDEAAGWAWMRTLTAIRLVIAARLGIEADDDGDHDDDPRFAVYDWLGYRLDGLVTALSDDE